jgi:hypothetical protein
MPRSKQTPLKCPRGRHEHDFSQTCQEWECAIFDRASYYKVVEYRSGSGPNLGDTKRETHWSVFPWAVRYAADRRDAVIYAVAPTGRFTCLDREKWGEWEQRWREDQIVLAVPAVEGD